MFKQVGYMLYSIRPSACLMVSLLVVAAYRPSMAEWRETTLLFSCAFFGSAYCFIINDLFDRSKDLLNNKLRPIATGELSVRSARFAAIIVALVYLFCAWMMSELVLGLAIFSLVLFSIYSPINNHYGFLSNLLVGFCASGVLWGVAILKDFEAPLILLSGALFFMIVFREILLDWLDMEGDKAAGKTSIPLQSSTRSTLLILLINLGLASAILLFSMIQQPDLSGILKIGLLLSIWIPFFYLALKPSRERVLFNIRFSHVSFVLLMLAIVLR